MTLQADLKNSPTPAELEQIFGPARENAQALMAELDQLAFKAGEEARLAFKAGQEVNDPLLSAIGAAFRGLVAPFRSSR